MIDATRKDIERAFRIHLDCADKCTSFPERLLLVYAAECGLKAIIMRNERAEITSELRTQIGHDIRLGLQYAHAPKRLSISRVQTKQKVPQEILPKDLQETFKYGIHIDNDNVVAELKAIIEWIRENLL